MTATITIMDRMNNSFQGDSYNLITTSNFILLTTD